MAVEELQYIKKLIDKQDTKLLKKTLEESSSVNKGLLLEQTLEHLYKGNGWLVSQVGGRSDAGADLLIYHPDKPQKPSFIVQAKNHKTRLSFDNTKIELIKFEEQARTKYGCKNYKLIALNGFVENAMKLEQFGMSLYDWSEIERLVASYSNEPTSPQLELVTHNKVTHSKINELFKASNKVAVIQATGTGKSYIIGQCLIDNIGQSCLVLAPNTYILGQQKSLLPWLTNVTYMTYARASNFTKQQWQQLNPSFIVMDEFHRAGAEIWGEGVKSLLAIQKKSRYLGTTATHIRFLDAGRNMADELFNNVIANELTLQEAIAREILPSPLYICALYQLKETVAEYKQKIEGCKAIELDKKKSIEELDMLLVDWEASTGVPDIFNKHLKNINGKYIVFCEDVEHLDSMSEQVRVWFRDAAKQRNVKVRRFDYIVHSQLSNKDIQSDLNDFIEADGSSGIHLLFSVNMLNEGLHIKSVNGVILLRSTTSPIIYFQQIGRCLQINLDEVPIIFDLVNNISNVKADTFSSSLEIAVEAEETKRTELGLSPHKVELNIIDETLAVKIALEQVSARLNLQLDYFSFGCNELRSYKNEFGNCFVPINFKTISEFNLGGWIASTRNNFKQCLLSESQIETLNDIGMIWDHADSRWNMHIEALVKYIDEFGDGLVPAGYVDGNGLSLGNWIGTTRKNFHKGLLSEPQIQVLNDIGMVWNILELNWNIHVTALTKYIDEFGDGLVPACYVDGNGLSLGNWVSTCRKLIKTGMLKNTRITELEEINFIVEADEYKFKKRLNELAIYMENNGDFDIPIRYQSESNFFLGAWLQKLKKNYYSGVLSEYKLLELKKINVDFSQEDIKWNVGFIALQDYHREFGHCLVPRGFNDKSDFPLSNWVNSRRSDFRRQKLSDHKINELENIGFVWEVNEQKFSIGLKSFELYISSGLNPLIDQKYIDINGFKLGEWSGGIRKQYAKENLDDNKIFQLESIGFVFDVTEYKWQKGFESLKTYIEKNQTSKVGSRYVDDSGFNLSNWVAVQKRNINDKKIDENHMNSLVEIGFKINS